MTHLSPAVFGVWSVSSALLTAFCFYHVWHYDRFRCLRLNYGPYSGEFKRLMAYTYILTLPLITTYSVGNAVIKYREGFVFDTQFGVSPKPYTQWTKAHQDTIFPLLMVFSIGFSLEMTTHLEELCFWMFLMNATKSSQNWFRSTYFRLWSCGSVAAFIYVPTVSVIFRHDPLQNEAYTFLAGGIGSLSLTLLFIPILYSFPAFLRSTVKQGVDRATIIRLKKFHELNRVRIIFRLLFVVPLVILGIDGVKPHDHPINESMFWTDIFGMVSACGCVVSSVITLLIFFPRDDENEYESSSLGLLNRLQTLQWKEEGCHPQQTIDDSSERIRSDFSSGTSIGSSQTPHSYLNHPLSFAPRPETEDGHDVPPGYKFPSIRNVGLDQSGDEAAEVIIPLPSAVNGAPLRPNRLNPNGHIELGLVQGLQRSGEFVSNWAFQFESPLDVMQRRTS